jgi:THO complex subunit 2
MANVQYTENLTEEQLDAMAGSETLRYQATSFGVTRNNKVSMLTLSVPSNFSQLCFK